MNIVLELSTDGAKGCKKSVGIWIITRVYSSYLSTCFNSNYGESNLFNSFRLEVCTSLTASDFLCSCVKYYLIEITKKCSVV